MYLGKTAINETDPEREQRFTVDKLILHPSYDGDTFNNDIGECQATASAVNTQKIRNQNFLIDNIVIYYQYKVVLSGD